MVRGQPVSVAIACALAAAGLVYVSPTPGALSQLRALEYSLPFFSVMMLVTAARKHAAPPRGALQLFGGFQRSGWPREGPLLLGSALIFSVASLATFGYLATVNAVSPPVPAVLAAMLVLGNALFGFAALMSYHQRARD